MKTCNSLRSLWDLVLQFIATYSWTYVAVCAGSSLAEREKDGKRTCTDTIVVLLGITIIPPYALLASQTHCKRAVVTLAFREQINLFWYSILPIRIIPVTSRVIYVPYPLFLWGKYEATDLKSSSWSHLFSSCFCTRPSLDILHVLCVWKIYFTYIQHVIRVSYVDLPWIL